MPRASADAPHGSPRRHLCSQVCTRQERTPRSRTWCSIHHNTVGQGTHAKRWDSAALAGHCRERPCMVQTHRSAGPVRRIRCPWPVRSGVEPVHAATRITLPRACYVAAATVGRALRSGAHVHGQRWVKRATVCKLWLPCSAWPPTPNPVGANAPERRCRLRPARIQRCTLRGRTCRPLMTRGNGRSCSHTACSKRAHGTRVQAPSSAHAARAGCASLGADAPDRRRHLGLAQNHHSRM